MQHPSTRSRSRRRFLRGCGLTLAGFGVASVFPTPLIRHALAAGPSNDRRLLFVFLRGGNDGLNALIPHGDPDYSLANRPSLYVPPASAIELNGFASLHPALAALQEGSASGDLALIHRVGYPNSSRSHFDGQRIWENGDPTQPQLFEGWLYRYIQENALATGADLPALSVQALTPVLLRGAEKFVNIATPASFQYLAPGAKGVKFSTKWREHFAGLVGLEPYRPVLSQTGVKLVDTLDTYAAWDQAHWDPKDPDSGWSLFPVSPETNQAGFSAEAYEFFGSLKVAALALLESDPLSNSNGTRVAGTQLGGWDLHDGQGGSTGRHAELLGWLAYALRSLRVVFSGAALDPRGYPSIWDKTVVTTLSEFGRTSVENGNGGTDHAAASCLVVEGGSIRGGVYNCDAATWPSGVMFGVDGRYLLQRTDYRAIFWELLRDHMGADVATRESIFPGYEMLGLAEQEPGLVLSGS